MNRYAVLRFVAVPLILAPLVTGCAEIISAEAGKPVLSRDEYLSLFQHRYETETCYKTMGLKPGAAPLDPGFIPPPTHYCYPIWREKVLIPMLATYRKYYTANQRTAGLSG